MTTVSENADDIHIGAFPTSISELHFSANSTPNLSSTLSSLKRSTLSTLNRLRSIEKDSRFIQDIARRYNLPLIANERCGSWYIPPERKAESAYFKSTDGHHGEWAFSMRRLNLQIFDIIGPAGGCVIVDSTRRGKSMPDALSKTVPIWCAVFNRFLFPECTEMYNLYTPESLVGPSEHAQIDARINGFVRDIKSLQLDISSLRSRIKKPLVPSWITPDFDSMEKRYSPTNSTEYNQVICCTASCRVKGAEASENGYIQGAADDHEGWSRGLTPSLFWQRADEFLGMAGEEDIGDYIERLVSSKATISHGDGSHPVRICPTNLYIASLSGLVSARANDYDAIITLTSEEPHPPENKDEQIESSRPSTLHIQSKPGKLGSRALRSELSTIISFLTPLFSSLDHSPKILITCHDGKDISIGVALAILCLFYEDDGGRGSHQASSASSIDKTMIRQRLAIITTAKPDVSPSRATLQSVHAFLMPGGV